jgi:hypothetical protein
MAGQRTITAQVNRPDGSGWPFAEFRFIPLTGTFTVSPDATYPRDTKTAIADSEGRLEVVLASGTGTSYQVIPPDDEPYTIIVEDGLATTLELIRQATEGAPIPQTTLESRVDAYLAAIGAGLVRLQEGTTTILAGADTIRFDSGDFDVTSLGSNDGNVALLVDPQPLDPDLTQIAGISTPAGDRILFYDQSASSYAHATVGNGLAITGTALGMSSTPVITERSGTAQSTGANSTSSGVTVTCNAGEISIGGGVKTTDTRIYVNSSNRSGTTGWTTGVRNEAGSSGAWTPTVLCMTVPIVS